MARALKVFRTSIGFHDAYVAAPSQKAALEAWGSERNLFGTGMAELVTDPALTKAPLARPGDVIKVKRGSARDHLAALPEPARKKAAKQERVAPRPRPRRTALDRAEKDLKDAEADRDEQLDAIDAEMDSLQDRRRRAAETHRARIDRLRRKLDEAADRYEAAIGDWRKL